VGRYQWVTELEDSPGHAGGIDLGIRNRDRELKTEEFLKLPRAPVLGLLDNIRSAYNVGSIFRTSDSVRIQKLYLCGMTAYPPNEKLEKTSLRSTPFVPWEHCGDPLDALTRIREEGYYIASLETADSSRDYMDFIFPEKTCIVLGHEVDGVSPPILRQSDCVLEVPTWGMKNSLNVASIFSIVVYEIIRQFRSRGVMNDDLFARFSPESPAGRDS